MWITIVMSSNIYYNIKLRDNMLKKKKEPEAATTTTTHHLHLLPAEKGP